jgi:hypothetical protein
MEAEEKVVKQLWLSMLLVMSLTLSPFVLQGKMVSSSINISKFSSDLRNKEKKRLGIYLSGRILT